jgi:hypothetical protein
MEESSETAQDLVGRVVPALVEHYRQNIHAVPKSLLTYHGNDTSRNSAVIQHWVTRLEDSNHSYENLMEGLLAAYQT